MAASMKKLFLAIIFLSLYGCVKQHSSLDTYQKTKRVDQNLAASYKSPASSNEEYANRIAKRILATSDTDANYTVLVTNDTTPILNLDKETHTVTISHGALTQLKDEAELAAIITLSIKIINNTQDIDRTTAIALSNAGYDPQALLDLQEEYFYTSLDPNKHWLQSVFPTTPTAGKISANKVMLQKMPKGLLRNAEDYHKQING